MGDTNETSSMDAERDSDVDSNASNVSRLSLGGGAGDAYFSNHIYKAGKHLYNCIEKILAKDIGDQSFTESEHTKTLKNTNNMELEFAGPNFQDKVTTFYTQGVSGEKLKFYKMFDKEDNS